MGNGIAHVAALAGFEVHLVDLDLKILDSAMHSITKNMNRQVKKNKITENEKNIALERLILSSSIKDCKDKGLIIEAVSENYEIKSKVFKTLDDICIPETILSSNTSSIPISSLSKSVMRKDKVIGMHFMNPVPIMELVEVINTKTTSYETTSAVVKVVKKLDKTPIECNDFPGFVSNRILMPMINEAILCVEQKVATVSAIDQIMKLGMAHPMGPLRLADLIGLDVCLDIMNVLYSSFKEEKYKPSQLLASMVKDGKLGKKSMEGFYSYD